MAFDILSYKPQGDKKNSDYFNEYRVKIFERRQSSGVDDLIENMNAVVVHVEHGEALAYMQELYLMTPYRYQSGYINDTHKIYFLKNKPTFPVYIILEPLSSNYVDSMTRLNQLYPKARSKPNARYIGEIFKAKDIKALRETLEGQDMRFAYSGETKNAFYTNPHFLFSEVSNFTGNRIGYTQLDIHQESGLSIGQPFTLTAKEKDMLAQSEAQANELGLDGLLLGIDHMATRILAGEREDAILEFLTMSNYYFWGAYNISSMNSSTNVNRNHHNKDDKCSPAKVFTANNTPSYVNSFEGLPMPTENFVRNYGRRMHHIAYEVLDGDHASGVKNVDYAVSKMREQNIPFLAHVVGECKDSPDLKQIFSKHSDYSFLITEYVERCHGFDGFFTKTNVAALTEAAGLDERFEHGHVFD